MAESIDALDSAIQDYSHAEEKGMSIGWFLIYEVMDEEGKRKLRWEWSKGMKDYQLKGYLHEALDGQLTGEIADAVKEDDS